MISILLPFVPLVFAGLLLLVRGRSRALAPLAVVGLLATLAVGGWAAATEPSLGWDWSPAIRMELAVEGYSRVMVLLVPGIAIPVILYAAVTEEEGRVRLLVLMLAFSAAMLLLVSAADFLTLLIAWELVGAISWALIGHGWNDPENSRAARQAFVTTRFGDLGLYLAAGLLFSSTGDFAFDSLSAASGWEQDAIAAGVLVAAAAKSAQVPFSPWLFAAMAGPTPVSALLHSATLVAAGAYLLIRVAPDLEAVGWLLPSIAGVGLATALAGGAVATLQTQAKRALAGSTSAQYGLMFIAVGASSTAAAGAHLVTHAAFKSLLFLAAGMAIHAADSPSLGRMGLGRALPRLAVLAGTGALALAAIPPLGGAWSKEEIVGAAVEAWPWLGAGALAAGFLSTLYAARFQLLAFGPSSSWRGGTGGPRLPARAAGRGIGSLALLSAATLGLSVLWIPGAGRVVEDASEGELFAPASWELALSLATVALALGTAWQLERSGLLLGLGLPPRLQAAAGDWLGLPALTGWVVVRPVVALSKLLAKFDDRVVDLGVRMVGRLAELISRLFSIRVEWTFDSVVHAVAGESMRAASVSRLTDEAGVDGAVEGGARAVGQAGSQSRRLQTGLAHHYYVGIVAGLGAIVAALALFGWVA